MAKIFELAGTASTQRLCAKMQIIARSARAREKRLARLERENYVFEQCRQARPKKKYRNTIFAEQCGRTGSVVVGVRVGQYTTCVCKHKI